MGENQLICPYCKRRVGSRVIDSRPKSVGGDEVGTKRRRKCLGCGKRFSTLEEAVKKLETVEDHDEFLWWWNMESKKRRIAMMPQMVKLIDLGVERLGQKGGAA